MEKSASSTLAKPVKGKKSIRDLLQAIERLHGCFATYVRDHDVREEHDGQVAWEGVVSQFQLRGHPQASVCYAWSSSVEGSDRRKFYAVLHIPPVDSPEAAVRASIVSDYRTQSG